MKTSQFLIQVPVSENKYLLYSTYNSKSIVLKGGVYKMLKEKQWESVPNELLSLLKNYRFVIGDEENELAGLLDENKNSIESSDILYYAIMPTGLCQLGCFYCGQSHKAYKESEELDKNLIKSLNQKLETKLFKHIQIGWFGGEPLIGIKRIESLTFKIKQLAKKYSTTYSASMPSNGYSLDLSMFKKLISLSVNSIEVTIDGLQISHDSSRFTKGQKGSFDRIFSNLKTINKYLIDLKQTPCKIVIRMNVHDKNFNEVIPLYNLLKKHKMNKTFGFYLAPVHHWGNNAQKNGILKDDFAQLEIELLKLKLKDGLNPQLLPSRKEEVCMAVNENSMIVDPQGRAYSCTEIPLVETYNHDKYIIEDLKSNIKMKINRPFHDWYSKINNRTSKSPCSDCEILPVCGGHCPKNWEEGIPDCPSIKFNLVDRLKLFYQKLDV